MKTTMIKALSISLVLGLTINPAHAIGDLFGKKEKSPSGDMKSVQVSQEKLVNTFVGSYKDIMSSQSLLLQAFGLKDEAEQVQAAADALSSSSVISKDQLKSAKKTSESANEKINEKMESKEQLSEEGKALYAKSFSPYVDGLKKLYAMKSEVKPFMSSAKSQISGASMLSVRKIKSKLESGMFIAQNSPSMIKELYSTSEKLMTYANDNNIELPEDSTSALGDL